jgi:hypothetical protein
MNFRDVVDYVDFLTLKSLCSAQRQREYISRLRSLDLGFHLPPELLVLNTATIPNLLLGCSQDSLKLWRVGQHRAALNRAFTSASGPAPFALHPSFLTLLPSLFLVTSQCPPLAGPIRFS